MNRRRAILVTAVGILLLLAFGGGYLLYDFTRPVPESASHVYDYEVAIQADATLTNVTLILPVPALGTESVVGTALVEGTDGLVETPPGWTYRLVETERGRMLAISAPTIPPRIERRPVPRPISPDGPTPAPGETPSQTPRQILDAYRIDLELGAEGPIETREPVGVEPTLVPRGRVTEVACRTPVPEGTVCRQFSTRASLNYETPENTTVEVYIQYSGTNSWFDGGWTGNSFDQTVSFTATGPQQGWHEVDAYEVVGLGNYRGAPA